MALNRVPIPERMQPLPRTESCDLAASGSNSSTAEDHCGLGKTITGTKFRTRLGIFNKESVIPDYREISFSNGQGY